MRLCPPFGRQPVLVHEACVHNMEGGMANVQAGCLMSHLLPPQFFRWLVTFVLTSACPHQNGPSRPPAWVMEHWEEGRWQVPPTVSRPHSPARPNVHCYSRHHNYQCCSGWLAFWGWRSSWCSFPPAPARHAPSLPSSTPCHGYQRQVMEVLGRREQPLLCAARRCALPREAAARVCCPRLCPRAFMRGQRARGSSVALCAA